MRKNQLVRGATTAVGVAALLTATMVASAGAAPQRVWLPSADLVCGETTVGPAEWTHNPSSGVLFVTSGEMAGHYVIQEVETYATPGHLTEVPESYDGMMPALMWTHGKKTGLDTITCTVLSRLGPPGGEFTVVGPVTLARVSD